MARRFIDLSIAIETDVISDPPPLRPQIKYWSHGETFHQIEPFFPGLKREDLPDGEGWAVEEMQLNPHNGTHMDAPWHYHSTAGGQPAPTIDQTPLDICFQRGVKLDFRHFADGYVATAQDIRVELDRIGHRLAPLDIVLVNTRAGMRYGHDDYLVAGCGIGREATLYLTEQGVKVVGTDAWSWDAPFPITAKRFADSGDPAIIWEGHKAGREAAYWQMEKLHNLEVLPSFGFEVICFPVKIKGAGAGWTRTVAMFT
ncbi:cyclase [Sphingomonas panacis]|uniref:Cyclase n=1 Tax=Sphingomonas panacis TaxID=1560345 RepID=A0A1B3ZA56_9SPHN|nr:cyclase family protein [Sphingomonas panacis]AOH84297.1 cyclase [Sphingomonas panacis]